MAAKGAHITQNSIEARPSIFEVVAADSLNATFYPALKRIANVSKRCLIYSFDKYLYLDIDPYKKIVCATVIFRISVSAEFQY